jgi:2-deoxystreptamine N-acetyl-D-glucosaminyltransferase/2-deoxystreptamine glucosyltransferase
VIVPSQYLSGIVSQWSIEGSRIRVIYNSVSPPAFKEPLELPPGFREGFKLLMVGRLVAHKRMDRVIELLTELHEARLVIVGDGPLRSQLADLVGELQLDDRVAFSGQIPQSQVWYLLEEYADVLVLPSVVEGLPHVLLEAASCGLPIVATRVGGVPEVVQHGVNGLLVPPDSPTELLEALRRLQNEPDLRRRLSENASRLAGDFNFDHMVTQTEKVLLGACA